MKNKGSQASLRKMYAELDSVSTFKQTYNGASLLNLEYPTIRLLRKNSQ